MIRLHFMGEMSNFGALLRQFLARKGFSQIELSKLTGINKSEISRVLAGKKAGIRDDQYRALVRELDLGEKDQADLLGAYLIDHVPNPLRESVEIQLRVGARIEHFEAPKDELQMALEAISRLASRSSDWRTIVVKLGAEAVRFLGFENHSRAGKG